MKGFFFAIGEESCESRGSSREDGHNALLFYPDILAFKVQRDYAGQGTPTRQAKQARMVYSYLDSVQLKFVLIIFRYWSTHHLLNAFVYHNK